MPTISGSCLCESVRYEVSPDFQKLNICHCKQCQRATGSSLPFQSKASNNMVVPAGTLDDPPKHVPGIANIFWSERAAWYDAAIKAECFDKFTEP